MGEDAIARAAVEAAAAGGDRALRSFRTTMTVEEKTSKTDVVTAADHAAQAAVTDRLAEQFPASTIVGEEDGETATIPETGRVWIVDPIDGTNNFVRGNRVWATSVACLEDGEPVAAATLLPATGDQYVGTPGRVTRNGLPVSVSGQDDPTGLIVSVPLAWDDDRRNEFAAVVGAVATDVGELRRIGSAQAALAAVAAGEFDAAVTNVRAPAWDTVAGAAMVEWAGGTVTDPAGGPWRHDCRGPVASNGHAHDAICEIAKAGDDAAER